MAKDNNKPNKDNNQSKSLKNNIINLNNQFNKNVDQLAFQIKGTTNQNVNDIENIDNKIDSIIHKELQQTKNITSDDMSTFMVKLFNDFDQSSGKFNKNTLDDIFSEESSGLFQFFQQRYQNKYLLYEDLDMITSQLFELDEAINTTRDSVVTSEDLSSTISKVLKFNYVNSNKNNENTIYIKNINKLEKILKLDTKVKNVLIPNVLKYGKFYIYVCPYDKIFEEQYEKKLKSNISTSLTESMNINEFKNDLIEKIKTTNKSKPTQNNTQNIKINNNIVESYTDNITICNENVSIPLIEGTDLSGLMDYQKFQNTKKSVEKSTDYTTTDGTTDINKTGKNKFNNISGCYIKFIDPKKIIPIKVLDVTIGYYYIHGTDYKVNKSPFSTTIKVSSLNDMAQNSEDVESMFISSITDKIVRAFDKPFLEKNEKFKDLILNALMYNDMYKRKINFQFIPAEYIEEFNVNTDENGEGQSVIMKSLFYAKLYLALLVFKMISIITKSNDTRVYYIRNSGLDTNITNKVQEVARSIKGKQINFMDLLNYNSIISKIGSYKEIFVPIGRSGEKGIDFDILSGQDVQLNTDLMEMLRTNMINGTGRGIIKYNTCSII